MFNTCWKTNANTLEWSCEYSKTINLAAYGGRGAKATKKTYADKKKVLKTARVARRRDTTWRIVQGR